MALDDQSLACVIPYFLNPIRYDDKLDMVPISSRKNTGKPIMFVRLMPGTEFLLTQTHFCCRVDRPSYKAYLL